MTFFAALIRRLGLSQSEAARYLNTPLDTFKAWSNGRRSVPPGVWAELRALADRQMDVTGEIVDAIERAPAGVASIEVNLPPGDWPGDGAAAIALVDAWLESEVAAPLVIIEPGSTPATALGRAMRMKIN